MEKKMTVCKECARRDKIIAELANALDELSLVVEDYQADLVKHQTAARKIVDAKKVMEIAWPPADKKDSKNIRTLARCSRS